MAAGGESNFFEEGKKDTEGKSTSMEHIQTFF
jgi:hypothetical protein